MLSKKLIAIIGCFFFLLSCKEELKLEFSDINVSTDNNDLVEVNIPFVTGNTLISDKINAAISKNVITALHIGNAESITSKSIEESIAIFNQEYDTFKTDFPETVAEWEAQIDGEVMFQSSEIISLAITKYTFTGGAHGILTITFLNFNAQTGNSIENIELFNNLKSFKTLAKTYFDKTVTDKNTLFEPENFELPANLGYNDEGIVLLYNTYEIAPYSTGIIEFLVPFEEAKPYLVFNSL
ncbi:DUF3298 and DUF4163 domain-containing protein [Sabulilitoribacter multivorans]|uniref:DUF3298 and DUF4163 domain-containing protein n=1 Tax=Flaviramulus multivorans TaxID=1304750 RepID=A0ABS9IH62_9FLAO|nr:DUF3298 and DUF4163 domain-containing protein [Flaviramulus multivorans]MCF7559718.1 DUF3298 and DUF4163 domain-containing protein [Flaviramulus multivorans]